MASALATGVGIAATSVLLLVALELPHIPHTAFGSQPTLVPTAALRIAQETLRYCWVNLACLALVGASLGSPFFNGWRGALMRAALLGGAVGYAYWIVQLYEPFAGYPLFIGALAALWAAAVLVISFFDAKRPRERSPWSRWVGFGLGLCALGVGAVLSIYNYRIYKGLYPTLHLMTFLVTHLVLGLGLCVVVQTHPSSLRRFRAVGVGVASFSTLIVALASALFSTSVLETARPHVTAYTMAGQSQVVFHRFKSAATAGRPQLPPDPEAQQRFTDESGLPVLEEGYLKGKNVLLITAEATRFDHTALAGADVTWTPNLRKFFEETEAFSFTRAYSASSGTLHSISSILSMSYPSSLPLETYYKPWHGKLRSDGDLVPQLFLGAGYQTFRVSHSFRDCFRKSILGFHYGFQHEEFFVEDRDKGYPNLDHDIADAALAQLKKAGEAARPFFGWVFFGGPHSLYAAHYDDMPAETNHDRYIQELRKTDEAMGRLFDGLREMGRLEDTVVLYFGDHGEEFGEHGGYYHKSTVYSESIRVPLLIYLPGKSGKEIHRPVSTYYTFPWLLRSGTGVMREVARRRIREDIAPMMRATDGAVLVELVGHDRMMSSLVYDKYKFNYDFLSSMYEVYDVESDPMEQKNLFDTNAELRQLGMERTREYLTVRAARSRFILKPEKGKKKPANEAGSK